MPRKIFYCVDFHCPAGGTLGYDGGAGGRLGGRRRPGGYLREADTGTPVSDILRAYNWARTNQRYSASLMSGLQAIAKCSPASDANARNASLHGDFNLYVFKYGDGRTTWIEEEVARPGNFNITFKDIADATHERWSRAYQTLEATVVTIDELRQMTTVTEENKVSDPEQMMKEFVEKKRKCGVKEDEYRRPKNQPHNLHSVDENEDKDKIKIIGEISKTELAGWTGSKFAVAFGGYSLQEFKRDIDSFPGAAVQTLTDKPVRYC